MKNKIKIAAGVVLLGFCGCDKGEECSEHSLSGAPIAIERCRAERSRPVTVAFWDNHIKELFCQFSE